MRVQSLGVTSAIIAILSGCKKEEPVQVQTERAPTHEEAIENFATFAERGLL